MYRVSVGVSYRNRHSDGWNEVHDPMGVRNWIDFPSTENSRRMVRFQSKNIFRVGLGWRGHRSCDRKNGDRMPLRQSLTKRLPSQCVMSESRVTRRYRRHAFSLTSCVLVMFGAFINASMRNMSC